MKAFWIFFFIQIAFSTQKLAKLHQDQILSKAVSDVIQELFIRHDLQFKTIIYDKVSPHIFDVINGLGRNGLLTNILSSGNTQETSERPVDILESTLIFCESLENVKKLFKNYKLQGRDFPRHIKFLFYIAEPFSVSQIEGTKINNDKGLISWFSYFLHKQNG